MDIAAIVAMFSDPKLLPLLPLAFWVYRLHIQIKQLERELSEHKTALAETENKIWAKLEAIKDSVGSVKDSVTSVLQGLAKLEGKMEAREALK